MFAIFTIAVLLVYGAIFVMRAVNEWSVADRQRKAAQAYYVTEAGSESGLEKLDEFINMDLLTTISSMNPQKVGQKAVKAVSSADGLNFLAEMVPDMILNADGTEASYENTGTNFGAGNFSYDIVVSEKSDPVVVAQDMWDFPFNYKIETAGAVAGTSKTISLLGDFTVRVQRDNFAKYALFTVHHGTPSGGTVWFTDGTNFAGPIHTNERFSYAGNSSLAGLAGIFNGTTTQHLSKARYYNYGSPIFSSADANGTRDVPVFNADQQKGYSEIVLASSVQKQDLYEQALGSQTPSSGSGIDIANDGSTLIGGIYVDGDATIEMGMDGDDNAQYTITHDGTTKIITVDIDADQTSVETVGDSIVTYTGQPKGQDDLGTIIYVNGSVTSLKGTVQRDTEVTVSCENDAVIQGNILYSDYTSASGSPGDEDYVPPNAEDAVNLLGVVSWGGNIRIGTSAPNNINIHGILMARGGMFTVDGYDDYGGSRGTATLLGGVITEFYGPFGLFNGYTGEQLSGYGRDFNYDSRTQMGKSPPYFPTLKTFIGFTNDLTDQVVYWEGAY